MNSYEEKIQRKIEYAKQRASQLKSSSDKFFKRGFGENVTGIPFGQPILVGHHSEQRHRNAIKKMDNQIRKNIEDSEKAEYYEQKANRLENNTVISSDDPEAITKLKNKLEALEKQREEIKEFNKKARKEKKEGHASYVLSNLGQNINSVKKRIKCLENKQNIQEIDEEINGVKLKTCKEDNRVRLFFEGIPKEEIRTKLKGNGFKWSPFNKCWQRQLTNRAIWVAKDILKEVVA